MDRDKQVIKGFEYAKERFLELGVDVEEAIKKADAVPLSMHCWQGDDVVGFDGADSLTGGIAVTGNYPGRARDFAELTADIHKALGLIPGQKKLNLHACYAVKDGRKVDRDAYTGKEFEPWVDFAKQEGLGLDFNPTFFSHPMMDGNLSLSSPDENKRRFWVEHGKRCREIGRFFAKRLGKPCVINFWMPDGTKDTCANTRAYRERMTQSLDEIFADREGLDTAPCALESKLFGVGVESFTVVSHEYSLGYALSRDIMPCMDMGHFHPTEQVGMKVGAVLAFADKLLLHVSRPVRWDSDHVVSLNDDLQLLMDELVFSDLLPRTALGMDYFDASINRVAAWAIGMRNARKALLSSFLAPQQLFKDADSRGDHTAVLALMEERRSLPVGAVWDYYCVNQGIPADSDWLLKIKAYERDVLSKRV